MDIQLQLGDALILVDVQSDFLPDGALAVPHGDAVIAPLNSMIARFSERGLPIFATRDWHPPDHCSFRAQGGPWPSHCVQGSAGAAIAAALRLPPETTIISKGASADADAYSGFEGTDLEMHLHQLAIRRLFIGGLATDYCVRQTVLDARKLDFDVILISDGIRGIDPATVEKALAEMVAAGAVETESN